METLYSLINNNNNNNNNNVPLNTLLFFERICQFGVHLTILSLVWAMMNCKATLRTELERCGRQRSGRNFKALCNSSIDA